VVSGVVVGLDRAEVVVGAPRAGVAAGVTVVGVVGECLASDRGDVAKTGVGVTAACGPNEGGRAAVLLGSTWPRPGSAKCGTQGA
jgi:hypothetical protein